MLLNMYGLNAEKLPFWLKTLIIIGGLVAILLAANKCHHYSTLRETGCTTTGEVIDIGAISRYSFIYTVDGKEYENSVKGKYYDVNVSGKYKVYYNCSDPEESFIDLDEKVTE